ncbi:MAG: efflux RND transporter permease subunit [Gammaproteobacteria bacterium]
MQAIVRFSLAQKVFYNLVFVLLTVSGFFAMSLLPAERYPNVNFGEVTISTFYPGASPTEVESLVTRKLEEQLEKVENIEWIAATSYPERSYIRLKFVDDSDYAKLYSEVRFKIQNIQRELPDEIDPPEIDNATVDDYLPVIAINLGGEHGNRALALMADQVKTRLKKIPEVKEVKISGEYIREFHIYLDVDKLRYFGLSFNEVITALQDANLSMPAGNFKDRNSNYLIKVDEKFHSREQVVSTVIRRDGDGSFIRLQDLISKADLDYRDPMVISTVNGVPTISLQIIKTQTGNAINIKQAAIDVLEEFEPIFERESVKVTLTQDSTNKIKDGLNTLSMNMLAGMLLVFAIIWYFMGMRNAGLIAVGIPFSFMMTMLLMYLSDRSLNEISLFAFVLVSGIIVDDAIVVCENIFRHIQQGATLDAAIIDGTAEVGLPVISSTLTTISAFLPMLIMSGATGEFFAEIPIAVSFALLASLFECLLILPIHYLDFGPSLAQAEPEMETDNAVLLPIRRFTNWALAFTLKFRVSTLLSIFLLLLTSIGIMTVSASGRLPLINIKFFPDDYTLYYVDVKGPGDMPIERIDEIVREIANFIMADGPGYAESASGFAGFYPDEDYQPVFGNHFGTVMVTLPVKHRQAFDDALTQLETMRERVKARFEKQGVTLSVHAQKDGPPTGKDINVRIVGNQFDSIKGLADEIRRHLETAPALAPYLTELEDSQGAPRPALRLAIDHERVKEYDLDSAQVTRLAGSVLDGRYIGKFRMEDEDIDLKVLISKDFINDPRRVLSVPVVEHASGPVRLGDVASLSSYSQLGELHRYQSQRAISIKANIKPGAPISTPVVIASISEFYQQISNRFPGAGLIFGGEHEDTQRSYTSLAYAFVIGLMAMYLILASQFQSYTQPIIILSAIAFALIGVIFGKLATQSLFTVNSFIAVIGVAGVVVNDSLILVDFMNNLYRSGLQRRAAIDKAISVRLRPIVLTTLTTTLGLLPMAMGFPEKSLVWGTMASTFVSGLATATLLTLIVVPVFWDMIIEHREKNALKKTSVKSV